MNITLIPIIEKIKEKDFPEYITKMGYDCLYFRKKNIKKVRQIIRERFNKIEDLDCESLGAPDFFIYNKKGYWFCEFKSINDSLRNEQICWFLNNKDKPKAVAFVLSNNKKYLEYLKSIEKLPKTEAELQRRKNWNKWHKITKKYCEKYHPSTMYKSFYKKNRYCYLGIFPEGLVKELKTAGVY